MNILMVLPRVFDKNSPISQVEMPLIKALETEGVKIDVITSDYYKDLDSLVERVFYVHESRFICLINRLLGRLKLGHLLYLPDYVRFSWNPFVKCQLKRILSERQYDFIQTSSFPSSSHLIGLYVKKKHNIPWVATFYDPWYLNPHRMPVTKYGVNINRKMEGDVATTADIIFHTNDIIIQRWNERYGVSVKNKIFVLPVVANSFNINGDIVKDTSKVTISHIGNLYGKRSATSFIEALSKLKKEKPESYKKIQVYFVGNVWQKDKEFIEEYGLQDVINCTGLLTEEECTQYYFKSDVLLAIDGDFNDNIFFPSKLVKYFYSKKPILGLTTPGSVLEDELIKSGHVHIPKNSIDSIIDFLDKVSNSSLDINNYDVNYCEKYIPSNVTSFYLSKLNSIKIV